MATVSILSEIGSGVEKREIVGGDFYDLNEMEKIRTKRMWW